MIAGLTQGACSMFGAWGDAVANGGSAGHVIQLRALDWDMDGPFRDFSQITVYHPAAGLGNAFASVGMSGFLGGLTGISEVPPLTLTNRPSWASVKSALPIRTQPLAAKAVSACPSSSCSATSSATPTQWTTRRT